MVAAAAVVAVAREFWEIRAQDHTNLLLVGLLLVLAVARRRERWLWVPCRSWPCGPTPTAGSCTASSSSGC